MTKWIAGVSPGLTWGTACFGTEVNSLVSGDGVLSSVAIVNGSNLDLFCDVSIICGSAVTPVAPGFISLYRLPLLHDGSTYGDGQLTTTPAVVVPISSYLVDSVGFQVGSSIVIAGMWEEVRLPPGTCKFGLYSQAGVTLPSSVVIQYRTYSMG